jgi:hypothetical protein
MTGISTEDVSVTSWGWTDDDGHRALADVATHRVWKILWHGKPLGFFAAPVDVDPLTVALLIAKGAAELDATMLDEFPT